MAINITDFSREDLVDAATNKLANTEVATALGITTTQNRLLQFYNRFGTNSIYQTDKFSGKIQQPYFFDVSMTFDPVGSVVPQRLQASLAGSSPEDLKFFVQGVEIPNLASHDAPEAITKTIGNVSIPGYKVLPESSEFTISFLSTELSLHEHVFYYWMKEATSTIWEYETVPFTRAKVYVKFLDQKDLGELFTYVFTGCYPNGIEMLKPTNEATSILTRPVTFAFNNMFIRGSKRIQSDVLNDVFQATAGKALSSSISGARGRLDNSLAPSLSDALSI